MTDEAMVTAVRRALATQAGVRVALLFGSLARGTSRPDSDVDLAVLVAKEVDRLALAASLTRALGREVDIVDLRDAGVPLLEEILRHAILVHEERPGAGALWRSRALAQLETDRPWYARIRTHGSRAWRAKGSERGQPRPARRQGDGALTA